MIPSVIIHALAAKRAKSSKMQKAIEVSAESLNVAVVVVSNPVLMIKLIIRKIKIAKRRTSTVLCISLDLLVLGESSVSPPNKGLAILVFSKKNDVYYYYLYQILF